MVGFTLTRILKWTCATVTFSAQLSTVDHNWYPNNLPMLNQEQEPVVQSAPTFSCSFLVVSPMGVWPSNIFAAQVHWIGIEPTPLACTTLFFKKCLMLLSQLTKTTCVSFVLIFPLVNQTATEVRLTCTSSELWPFMSKCRTENKLCYSGRAAFECMPKLYRLMWESSQVRTNIRLPKGLLLWNQIINLGSS